jgi:hypothetical protein
MLLNILRRIEMKIRFRNGTEKEFMDLSGADLRNADLSSADLSDANLRDANLSSADLRDANLSSADLRDANLSSADLSNADLSSADLSDANLSSANLSSADLSSADLSGANLRDANLSSADLRDANLSSANLSSADLSGANLRNANLRNADLSSAIGLLNPIDFLKENFVQTDDGFVVYKTFNRQYSSPSFWILKGGSFITEVVNYDPCCDCACGINFATKEWIQKNIDKEPVVWKCLLTWEGLATLCVPYNSDGKARCGQLLLIEKF